MKEQFRESHSGCKISGISFGVLSANQMRQMAHINVLTNNLYEPNTRKPALHGVLDLRLGTSIKSEICQTCGKNWADCSGHFGYIDLEMPCFHVGFFRSIINILQCICKSCSSILLDPKAREVELAKVSRPNMSYLEKKAHRKRIIGLCRKNSKCPYCGEYNGVVKKCSLLKIVHIKFQHGKRTESEKFKEYVDSFENAVATNKELGTLLQKAQEVLNPLKVMELFKRIPCSDIGLLLMDHHVGRPQDLILTRIFVPPTCIRPSVVSELKAGTTEDDITMRLLDIIQQNNNLVQMAQNAGWMGRYMEVWDYLQLQVALLYNSELSGIPKFSQESKKPLMGIIQRLKGKQGRFRGNLSGKRVNFSARTVISPDPHLRIDQVGLPMYMAKILTFPERVTAINYERMRQLVLNGKDVHPGAGSVVKDDSKIKFHVFNSHRNRMARDLKIGDIVNRYIWDGDVVLFNRQPSLHRLSIQAFRVKVTNSRTLQFNECCCNPFNADFDGDEMNIHFPQTEEAKAEALVLMESKSNIISPRNGDPLIAGIQDFITGAYLLTQKNNFFTIDEVMRVVNALIDSNIDLPRPAILKPVKLWTGKQLFSLVMRPNKTNEVLVNLRIKCTARIDSGKPDYHCPSCTNKILAEAYKALASTNPCACQPGMISDDPVEKVLCEECCVRYGEIRSSMNVDPCSECSEFNRKWRQDELDPDDDYIVVHNSHLLAGNMDKGTLGSGSKNSIFYFILRDFGKDHAADALLRLSKLSSFYLILRGFSIGISDVTPGSALLKTKQKLLKEGYVKCNDYIYQYDNGQLQVAPGCSEEETLEGILLNTLSDIRDEAGRACHRDLPKTNSPLIMSIAGSKGSNVNISQMIACVGQQSVSGKRVPNGFEGRTLPHFVRNSKDPAAKGFVANSFFSGLTPIESFLHAIAGREGLVDTAVKTAETGYMQRRLVKALEDLYCAYDGTVRNSVGEVIQFVYGSDGLDPMAMEAKYKKSKNNKQTKTEGLRPIDFARILEQICRANPCSNEVTLTGEQVLRIYSRLLELNDYKFMKSHKLSKENSQTRKSSDRRKKETEGSTNDKTESSSNQPERARNFGRHMRKFVDSLVDNLKEGRVLPDGVCKHSRITRTQLENFISMCSNKFMSAQMEPGTTVGALAAQSIGEPSTQMTLKTFHFAGVASMNITQGVPRILEIINATKSISTPVAKCPIEVGHDEGFARRVKGRIEKTTLGEITQSFVTNIVDDDLSVVLKLDLRRIELLKLEVSVHTIRRSLLRAVKLKLEHADIDIISRSEMIVRPSKNYKGSPLWALYNLRVSLPNIIVSGIPTVKRVVMQAKGQKDKDGKTVHELIVEGTNLQAIMTTPGVVGTRVESNNIMEINTALGIEAARASIIAEMTTTMAIYGISVDKRHIMLIADLMTYRGDVMGINRGGMARMRESALMLASFEKTADHLFEAAYHGQMDAIRGVSERIIMGIPMDIGTGMIDVFQKIDREPEALMSRATLFESYDVHLPDVLLNASQNSAGSSTSGEGQ